MLPVERSAILIAESRVCPQIAVRNKRREFDGRQSNLFPCRVYDSGKAAFRDNVTSVCPVDILSQIDFAVRDFKPAHRTDHCCQGLVFVCFRKVISVKDVSGTVTFINVGGVRAIQIDFIQMFDVDIPDTSGNAVVPFRPVSDFLIEIFFMYVIYAYFRMFPIDEGDVFGTVFEIEYLTERNVCAFIYVKRQAFLCRLKGVRRR